MGSEELFIMAILQVGGGGVVSTAVGAHRPQALIPTPKLQASPTLSVFGKCKLYKVFQNFWLIAGLHKLISLLFPLFQLLFIIPYAYLNVPLMVCLSICM